ncbi:hypothetical protein M758_3G204400 [Ceratodon purpureus]|nr:hypothetical protein M758_3G204400 [Ceratodon purpureus]
MTETGTKIRLYIPGFRSKLLTSARVGGKMARDMDFVGPTLLYSWGAGQNFEYLLAQKTWLTESIPQLVQIFRDVKEHLPDADVGVISHSLGTKLVIEAVISNMEKITGIKVDKILEEGYDRRTLRRKLGPKLAEIRESLANISQIVLAASDQSTRRFGPFCHLLRRMRAVLQITYTAFALPTVTVYCSRDDLALVGSKIFHLLRLSRLGRTRGCQSSIQKGKLKLIDGECDFVDMVDVTGLYKSEMIGHSYYSRSDRVLNDMKKVFNGERARDRAAARDGAGAPYRDRIHPGYVHANGTIYAFIPEASQASMWTVAWHFVFPSAPW